MTCSSFDVKELFPLAQGGMGTAVLACILAESGFERFVVLKRLHEDMASDPFAYQRLLEEAELAGLVHHANVVPVQHVGQDEHGMFLVMDYIEGASLSELIQRARPGRVPLGVTLRLFHDALMGLEAIHSARDHTGERLEILHRDATPENILVGLDGVARLTDFGIAKARGSEVRTAPMTVIGKLGYMAPEYILGEDVGPAMDVYSMGVSLWTVLSGRSPWQDTDRARITALALAEGVPALPAELGLPEELVALVARACAMDAAERPQSARCFVTELERCCRHLLASRYEVEAWVREYCENSTKRLRMRAADSLRESRFELTRSESRLAVAPAVPISRTATTRREPAPELMDEDVDYSEQTDLSSVFHDQEPTRRSDINELRPAKDGQADPGKSGGAQPSMGLLLGVAALVLGVGISWQSLRHGDSSLAHAASLAISESSTQVVSPAQTDPREQLGTEREDEAAKVVAQPESDQASAATQKAAARPSSVQSKPDQAARQSASTAASLGSRQGAPAGSQTQSTTLSTAAPSSTTAQTASGTQTQASATQSGAARSPARKAQSAAGDSLIVSNPYR